MRTVDAPDTTTMPVAPGAVAEHGARETRSAGYPAGGAGFDWLVVALGGWLIGGLHLDGWAHNHIPELETFFTPWHGVLYSGFLALFLALVCVFARNIGRGYPWRRAMPMGYGLSLAGGCLFLVGGVLDMLWHIAFGVEVNTEALLSPTHLILATGAILMLGGPVRAQWQRTGRRAIALPVLLPALLSVALIVAVLAFFTQFAHSQVDTWAAPARTGRATIPPWLAVDLGVASILLQATILSLAALLLIRRWTLPFGSLTLVFALPSVLISFMHDRYAFIPAAILAGLLADALIQWLRPTPTRRTYALRGVAFAIPALYYALYFVALALTAGIGWTIHLWAGAIIMAGSVGLLLSYLITPPATPGQIGKPGI